MNQLPKLIALLAAVLITVSAQAATTELPTLDAKFETTQCAIPCKKSVKRNWWMMRTAEQVELRDAKKTDQLANYGEVWQRTGNGKLSYFYLMHDDKRAIEYASVDLNMLGIATDDHEWQMQTQLVTEGELATMKKNTKKTSPYKGLATESYTGMVKDAKVNLVWIPELKIPLIAEYVYPKRKVTIRLRDVNGTNVMLANTIPSTFKIKATDLALQDYQQIYYTDIGDMEQEAGTQSWLVNAEGAPGLHAHRH